MDVLPTAESPSRITLWLVVCFPGNPAFYCMLFIAYVIANSKLESTSFESLRVASKDFLRAANSLHASLLLVALVNVDAVR